MKQAVVTHNAYKDFDIKSIPGIWGLTFKQEWLVENLIPSSAVTMISGESGCGKSTFTLALADAVSRGVPFLGYNTAKTTTLILDRENGLPVYHERLPRFDIKENPNLIVWGGWVTPPAPGADEKLLYDFVSEHKPLIIFDSFISFHPGDEQDATETRQYMDHFRALAGLGATIVLVHHTGKGETTKVYRGSSDIKASVDVLFQMKTVTARLKHVKLTPDKVREGNLDTISLAVEGTKWVLMDSHFIKDDDPDWQRVFTVIGNNPGINQQNLLKLVEPIPSAKVRKILAAGASKLIITKGLNNASLYTLGPIKQPQ